MIRPAHISDIAKVVSLDEAVLKTNWNDRLYTDMLTMDHTFFIVSEEQEAFQGFNLYRNIGGDFEILQFAIDPKRHHQGLGSLLMEVLINHAQMLKIENIYLEVRVSNTIAIAFYTKYGFERIHVRENYYGPQEDGLVMKREC